MPASERENQFLYASWHSRSDESKVLTFEEEGGLVGNQVTGKILRRVHQADDSRSPQIGSLDKVEKGRGTTHLLLNFNSSLHHGQCLLRMLSRFVTEALDGAEGLVFAAATDQPPRGFGREENENQERSLQRVSFRRQKIRSTEEE